MQERIVTAKDLQALIDLMSEIQEKTEQGAKLSAAANTAVMTAVAAGALDTAASLGVAAIDALARELADLRTRALRGIEEFIGERPVIGETAAGFMSRIAHMSAEDMIAAQQRNGIRLVA